MLIAVVECYNAMLATETPPIGSFYCTPILFIMTSYTKGTRKKSFKKYHMVEKYEIKNSTSCAKHGRLTYSDPSLMKISSSSMRAVSTVPWPTICRKYLSILLVDTHAMSSAVKPYLLQQCCTLHPTAQYLTIDPGVEGLKCLKLGLRLTPKFIRLIIVDVLHFLPTAAARQFFDGDYDAA